MKLFKKKEEKKSIIERSENRERKNIWNIFDSSSDIEHTWRDLDALPKEILSKEELDRMQAEVVGELDRIQNEEIAKAQATTDAKPQSIFYCHKYIDAKFNKNAFDIESHYVKKQNTVDHLYAEGYGELLKEVTGYKELLDNIKREENRMLYRLRELDPRAAESFDSTEPYDDPSEIEAAVASLPTKIQWKELEEK